jgi:hypothetical protein
MVPLMPGEVTERVVVATDPRRAYDAVSDVRRMGRRSPECFAVVVYARRAGAPARFVGFNRRGPFVWFTTCRVVVAEPGREFAFDVAALGRPVARWGYRFAPADGGTEVTEYWVDRRTRGAWVLGRVFTGRSALHRPEINRDGMRTTLAALKAELEGYPR